MSERSHVLRRTITLSFSSAIGYQHLSVNLLLDVMRMYGCWIFIKEGQSPHTPRFYVDDKTIKGRPSKAKLCLSPLPNGDYPCNDDNINCINCDRWGSFRI